jgi:hypothetical protein
MTFNYDRSLKYYLFNALQNLSESQIVSASMGSAPSRSSTFMGNLGFYRGAWSQKDGDDD